MSATQRHEKFSKEEAERFAGLWSGFDLGNTNEAEALGKGGALRRMMVGKTLDDGKALRLVDALELPEIRAALDAQLQPVRAEKEEVGKLYEQITELAEVAHRQEQTIEDLRRQLAGAASMAAFSPTGLFAPVPPGLGGFLAFASVMGGAALLFTLGTAALRWFERLL